MKTLFISLYVAFAPIIAAHAQQPVSPVAALKPEAKRALLAALACPYGEYAGVAVHASVIEKHGMVQPHWRILQDDLRRKTTLQQLLKKYTIAFQSNPYVGNVHVPDNLERAARAALELAKRNNAMYDRLLPQVSEYSDIADVFRNNQDETRDLHIPLLKAAASRYSKPPAKMRRTDGSTLLRTGAYRRTRAARSKISMRQKDDFLS